MKQINKYRALCLVVLAVQLTGCHMTSYPIAALSEESGSKTGRWNLREYKIAQFVQLNWSNLTSDMAKGQGENLSVMADLLSIQGTKKAAFYAMSKDKFTQLIPSPNTTPEQLVINLKTESAKL